MTTDEAIAEYLRTGHVDPMHAAWTGTSFVERAQRAEDELVEALLAELRARAGSRRWGARVELPAEMARFTREQVEPMVRGLFARTEQQAILRLIETSVVLVTDDSVEQVIRDLRWLPTVWRIANLYLASIGAEVLGDAGDVHVGLSEDLACYVTPEYFLRREPFVDFVVHECAHVLHDCKLERIGLRPTRSRERLVELEFRERETFAYACEAFATVAAVRGSRQREALVNELVTRKPYPVSAVDVAKVEDIVREAAARRNGWKHVLESCSVRATALPDRAPSRRSELRSRRRCACDAPSVKPRPAEPIEDPR